VRKCACDEGEGAVKITAFQQSVYDTISRVPRGSVTTYMCVAREVGCRSCRAVGQALRANPFAPEVPCHRVIASDLTVGGFRGESSGDSVRRKIGLLAEESVFFKDGRLADPGRVFRFDHRKDVPRGHGARPKNVVRD
jgi:methylated-DNA-[protein]-cysteine S-methyltransferase